MAYEPTGKILKLLAAVEAEPMREFHPREVAVIADCDVRAVTAMVEYARRARRIFRRREGRAWMYRGTPYRNREEAALPTGGRRKKQDPMNMRAAEVRKWDPTADDPRIPKVVPGWRPPVMVPPRGCV